MCDPESDPIAEEWFDKAWMPNCLRIPVAARSVESLARYVGAIESDLSRSGRRGALLVRYSGTPPRRMACNLSLPVWQMDAASVLHANPQVWVDVDYTRYAHAYAKAFPSLDLRGLVVDHIENRRRAREVGWRYLRLCHVSNPVNVSSGQGAERLGVEFAKTLPGARMRWGEVRFADVADLAKMLGIRLGGGSLDGLRDALHLFEPAAGRDHRGPCSCD